MSKIKEAKRSILQIMPADGWMAVCTDEEGDGTPPQTTRVPLFAWAIVRDIEGKRASTATRSRTPPTRTCSWRFRRRRHPCGPHSSNMR